MFRCGGRQPDAEAAPTEELSLPPDGVESLVPESLLELDEPDELSPEFFDFDRPSDLLSFR